MPTFDFRCAKCAHTFEFTRPFGGKEIPKCPACGSKKTEKQLSVPAVVFKGSGWYKTEGRKVVTETKRESEGKTDGEAAKAEKAIKAEPTSAASDAATAGRKETPAKTETKKPAAETGVKKTEEKKE